MRSKLFIFLMLLGLYSRAATITDTLYINRAFVPIYTSAFYYCAFNQDTAFSRTNTNYNCEVFDSLLITVINNDTVTHDFTIDGIITSSNSVSAGGQILITFSPQATGSYRYYSSQSNGGNLGASGVIVAGYSNYMRYTWNLFDQDSVFAEAFHLQNVTSIDTSYHPGVFMINGVSYPQTVGDSAVEINAMVGDSIVISIVNSGHMAHSIHFHGYHVKILSSEKTPMMNGWFKDSFPVKEDDKVTILLVPHQDGMYPVHDHNLIATTNLGLYPGGMIVMLNVMP